MPEQIQILIVDDLPRTRQSLRALLSTYADNIEIEEAKNGLEALERIDENPPNVVVMDIRMPGLDGINATQVIKRHAPGVKVIAISMSLDYETDARAAGADAFVCKGDPPARLLQALSEVIAGSPENHSRTS